MKNKKRITIVKCIDLFGKEAINISSRLKKFHALEVTTTSDTFEPSVQNYEGEPLENVGLTCLICRANFDCIEAQKEHQLLDWHRYNAKQKILSKPPISEEQFETDILGELSSISGSDSESDLERTTASSVYKHPDPSENKDTSKVANTTSSIEGNPLKSYFVTADNQLVSVYKNIVKENDDSVTFGTKWVYVLLSSGHFAGVVFDKNTLVAHKTFHRYTVRAKRGTAQSNHDSSKGQAKSFGSSVRRYNERALVEEVQDLLLSWSHHLKEADSIFYKCPKVSTATLFGEKTALSKDDNRVCKISTQTKRPTLNEVKRIHSLYSHIEIHGPVEDLITHQQEPLNPTVPTPVQADDTSSETKKEQGTHLKQRPPKVKINVEVKEKQMEVKEKQKDEEDFDASLWMWKNLYDWCTSNNIDNVKQFFNNKPLRDNNKSTNQRLQINHVSKQNNNTLLHRAVTTDSREIVSVLLENGADPCVRNNTGELPYTIASKPVRNEFRIFRSNNPDKYNYEKARVDGPMTLSEEDDKKRKENEKKKAKNKARKEKLKIKKAEENEERLIEEERRKFEQLSDREKRALAAERRIAVQKGAVLKCDHCFRSINGRPFERYEYKYCTTACVQKHRLILEK